MSFVLSSENVVKYLQDKSLCKREDDLQSLAIESKSSKNFNLLVSFSENGEARHLLIKQELLGTGEYDGVNNSLAGEWRIHELLNTFPELNHLCDRISEAIYFDRENSIVVMNYFPEYEELGKFYDRENSFPLNIAANIGNILADIHRSTFNIDCYRNFLKKEFSNIDKTPNYFVRGTKYIFPGVFGKVTKENLQFFKLYQRYPSFRKAVFELNDAYQPSCLVHNDLKLDNLLLSKNDIRIVDWELFTWGDPAYDLGNLLAQYLKMWLCSFLVSTDLEWQIALQLATTPLNLLQPSIKTVFQSYCDRFPEIWQYRSDFLHRVVQFMGIALIKRAHRDVDEHEPLTNRNICMLQVAKNLLCEPEKSIPTIFGVAPSQLINFDRISA
jgi:5-methylthioribose kinase